MQTHRLTLSLSDQYYLHIGAVIHRWATLEYLMMAIIWKSMGLGNKEGRVLTVGMGTQVLAGILRNLPRKWITDEAIVKKLKQLTDEVSEHHELRNYLAHGVWTYPEDKAAPRVPFLNFMKSGEHRLLPGGEPVTPEQLAILARSIGELNQLADEIHSALPGPAASSLSTPEEPEPLGFPNPAQNPK